MREIVISDDNYDFSSDGDYTYGLLQSIDRALAKHGLGLVVDTTSCSDLSGRIEKRVDEVKTDAMQESIAAMIEDPGRGRIGGE